MCEPHGGKQRTVEKRKLQTERNEAYLQIQETIPNVPQESRYIKKTRLQITSNVRLNSDVERWIIGPPLPFISHHQIPHLLFTPQAPPGDAGRSTASVPATPRYREATRLQCLFGAASGTPSHDGAREGCIYAVGLLVL